jgi:hypothetical protein
MIMIMMMLEEEDSGLMTVMIKVATLTMQASCCRFSCSVIAFRKSS